MLKAGFYIDGFNFYHAINDFGDDSLKWMSYMDLCSSLLGKDEQIEIVKIVTAYPGHAPDSNARHEKFVAAQRALGCKVILGKFKERVRTCSVCNNDYWGHEEKESDVNLALHLYSDCFEDRVDVAYLITGDSDITPVIRMLRQKKPKIKLITVNSPGRPHSKSLVSACHETRAVNRSMVKACMMPHHVVDGKGVLQAIRPFKYDPIEDNSP